ATASSFVGMVVGFERKSSGSWAETVTLTPFETITNRFGAALALVGDELWIGAPFSDGREGRIYRATFNADGALTGMVKFGGDSLVSGSGFGNAISVSGNTVAIAMPADGGGEGTVQVYSRSTSGDWRLTGHIYPQPAQTLTAITGGEKACADDGKVSGFGCSNSSLISFLPIRDLGGRRGTSLNDNWGWTDSTTGREYALVGRTDGTSFVDVTDPARPRYLGDLPLTKG